MYVSKVAKRFKGQWNSVVTKSLNFIPSQSRTMSHARKKLKDLNKQKRELNQNDYFFFHMRKMVRNQGVYFGVTF